MKRRNIAVFFDGTGQCRDYQPCYHWTNVVLLHDAISAVETEEVIQSRRYFDGVGTRESESLSGGGLGIGLDERIEEACDFLYQEFDIAHKHNEDPHVYLFGFSRGAFAARWLASLLDLVGVSKGHPTSRKLFEIHRNEDVKAAKAYVADQKVYHPISIDFLGVWDTVEASADKIKGLDRVPGCVSVAYHALAIDEWRSTFKPTRFAPSGKVTEVWFPGCHTDVGGGYESRTLADAPLWWIVSGCRKCGLLVDEAALRSELDRIEKSGVYHDELAHSILWKGLNRKDGYDGKYFREIRPLDNIDATVAINQDAAPVDRQGIPSNCVVMNQGLMDGRNEDLV